MQHKREHTEPQTEQPPIKPRRTAKPKPKRNTVNWENIHLFLAVGRDGSFRAAAIRLGISFNKIRRRVQELEKQVGFLLMTRHVEGVQLTEEGRRLFSAAEQMEKASLDGLRYLRREDKARTGLVRIAASEGLGMSWIMPEGIAFQRANPGLVIDINCQLREADLLRMQADIGVQLHRPKKSDLICTRLAVLHVIPFAATRYLKQYGRPKSLSEVLEKHRIVEQQGLPVDENALAKLMPDPLPDGLVAIRANTSTGHYLAVSEGAGIGMLPSYAASLNPDLQPLELKLRQSYEIWMSYHPDAARIERVRMTMDWLKKLFSSRRHPWFREQFVPPEAFAGKSSSRPKLPPIRPSDQR